MSKLLNDTTRNVYLANCLYDCVEDNDISAIKKLLKENNANPNIIIPNKGITPFHLAIGSGSEDNAVEITKLFLDYGGNPNVRSNDKLTPVHIAAAWGRLKVLIILLQSGGDPNLADEEGKTALDYAELENYDDIIEYIQNFDENIQKYDLILNKIIINSGDIVAEYETKKNDLDQSIDLNSLPKSVNSFVSNWCLKHANISENIDNKDDESIENKTVDKILNISISSSDNNLEKSVTYISSEDSASHRCYSRESGILTINDNSYENILNKCIYNSDDKSTSNSDYVTCTSVNTFEKNISNSLITLDLTEQTRSQEIINITSDISTNTTNIPCQLTAVDENDQKSFNIQEEYKYTDNEEGIVLIEKRILVNPKIDDSNKSIISDSSKISSLPSVINYDTDTLRKELTNIGEPPGPITKTTKRIYLKKLKKLQKYTFYEPQVKKSEARVYSLELQKTILNPNWNTDLTSFKALESVVANQFNKPDPAKRWREGCTKASFTYLLLDPRITLNLPLKAGELPQEEIWETFLSAIFYVGKGKRSRPYSHLYEAVLHWNNEKTGRKCSKKINYILDIWKNNYGVVCLHIFQNVIPVEAYTREAAMINALRLQNLCNAKLGDFYGICATWPQRKKRLLGVYLLYRAMLIFLNEGERQLMPEDIGK